MRLHQLVFGLFAVVTGCVAVIQGAGCFDLAHCGFPCEEWVCPASTKEAHTAKEAEALCDENIALQEKSECRDSNGEEFPSNLYCNGIRYQCSFSTMHDDLIKLYQQNPDTICTFTHPEETGGGGSGGSM